MDKRNIKEGFIKKHPILWNALLIGVAFIAIVYAALFLIDIFTEHGKYKIVPNVKNLSLQQAASKIEEAGFTYEITDSIYDDHLRPGQVTEQSPKGNSKVKSNRIIYLSINAFSPRLITFPNVKEISLRQAQAILEGLGVKNVRIEEVYSPFKDLVIDAKMNGLSLRAGTKIPTNAYITLQVGNGSEMTDSLDINSLDSTNAIGANEAVGMEAL